MNKICDISMLLGSESMSQASHKARLASAHKSLGVLFTGMLLSVLLAVGGTLVT